MTPVKKPVEHIEYQKDKIVLNENLIGRFLSGALRPIGKFLEIDFRDVLQKDFSGQLVYLCLSFLKPGGQLLVKAKQKEFLEKTKSDSFVNAVFSAADVTKADSDFVIRLKE